MGEHPINNLMGTVMENIKGMVDVNTIIGDPVETSSGTGVSISPIGFLVVTADQIKLIPISSTNTPIDKLIDYIPEVFDKVNGLIKKIKNDN